MYSESGGRASFRILSPTTCIDDSLFNNRYFRLCAVWRSGDATTWLTDSDVPGYKRVFGLFCHRRGVDDWFGERLFDIIGKSSELPYDIKTLRRDAHANAREIVA